MENIREFNTRRTDERLRQIRTLDWSAPAREA
jgi:hypothetical protein